LTVGKYQDGLPLYRQEKILQRIGMEISRATLAFWMIQLGRLIQPVMNLPRDQMLAYDVLYMDETTVQVLKEPGKTAQSRSYLWSNAAVRRGNRSSSLSTIRLVAKRCCCGYSTVIADIFRSMATRVTTPSAVPGIRLVGCMAHAPQIR